ncbi:MAG: arylesterase, partial [Pseudomonadota bacterium]
MGVLRRVARGYGAVLLILNLTFAAAQSAAADEIVIAALGDSLTQGFGLPEADGFVPQMEAWLRARGHDVRMVNAGQSGDTTAGGLSRVGWTMTEDVDAVIVALGGNDLLRGIDPEASRANLDGILTAITERGLPPLLIGMTAPGNYGPQWKAAFDAMYPELAEEHGALYVESFMAGLLPTNPTEEDISAARGLMQDDGIHPNAEGVA